METLYSAVCQTIYKNQCTLTPKEAVPWLWRLDANTWKLRLGFGSKIFHQGYVVEKSGTIVSSCLSLSILPSQDYSPHALYSFLSNVVLAARESGQDL